MSARGSNGGSPTVLRSGHLNDDQAYVRAMARQSEFPYRYVTRFAPPNRCPVSQCYTQRRPGGDQMDALNNLIENMPTRVLEQGNRPNTELWGTSPFRARGDGQLLAPDASNVLMRLPISEQRCARPLSEIVYPRFDYISFPNNAEYWRRGGVSSRLGPIYVQPIAFVK
jgi:hypothetical protein